MAKVCFASIRAVATNKFGSESWPGGVGATVDGRQPGGLDWVSCCGMQICNESRSAGEVVCTRMGKEVVRRRGPRAGCKRRGLVVQFWGGLLCGGRDTGRWDR